MREIWSDSLKKSVDDCIGRKLSGRRVEDVGANPMRTKKYKRGNRYV